MPDFQREVRFLAKCRNEFILFQFSEFLTWRKCIVICSFCKWTQYMIQLYYCCHLLRIFNNIPHSVWCKRFLYFLCRVSERHHIYTIVKECVALIVVDRDQQRKMLRKNLFDLQKRDTNDFKTWNPYIFLKLNESLFSESPEMRAFIISFMPFVTLHLSA